MHVNLLKAPTSPVVKKPALLAYLFFHRTLSDVELLLTRMNGCVLEKAIRKFSFSDVLKKVDETVLPWCVLVSCGYLCPFLYSLSNVCGVTSHAWHLMDAGLSKRNLTGSRQSARGLEGGACLVRGTGRLSSLESTGIC